MDRFIDFAFTNPRTKMINLKSNMDRFIVETSFFFICSRFHLKSNMDRFIVFPCSFRTQKKCHLKSNMDRFIG